MFTAIFRCPFHLFSLLAREACKQNYDNTRPPGARPFGSSKLTLKNGKVVGFQPENFER